MSWHHRAAGARRGRGVVDVAAEEAIGADIGHLVNRVVEAAGMPGDKGRAGFHANAKRADGAAIGHLHQEGNGGNGGWCALALQLEGRAEEDVRVVQVIGAAGC